MLAEPARLSFSASHRNRPAMPNSVKRGPQSYFNRIPFNHLLGFAKTIPHGTSSYKMKSIARQTGLLSARPLRGYYRYKDLFQILPLATKNEPPQLMHDSPLTVEICYCPDIWPHRDQLLWYRDLWERERLEYFRDHSSKKEVDHSTEWFKAYERLTKQLRWPAITNEVSTLLTLFTNHRFFTYGSEQYWFILDRTEEEPDSHQWGQLGYLFDKFEEDGAELSDPAGAKAEMIPMKEYYARIRDEFALGEDNIILLPENIDVLFDLYFGLDPNTKTAFYTACSLYNQSLELRSTYASLSLVSTVMAIEGLVNCVKDKRQPCPECNAPRSIETCPVCGLPRHRVRSRFKTFLLEFCSELPKKFADALYDTRSKLAHGGLLRDDLYDSGFYGGHKDEEQRFRRKSLVVIRIAILNWLMKPQPDLPAGAENHAAEDRR